MSWLLVAVNAVAFIAGGFAVIEESWPLFWVCLVVLVLSVPAIRFLSHQARLGRDPSASSKLTPVNPVSLVAEDLGSILRPSVDIAPAAAVTAEQPAVSS